MGNTTEVDEWETQLLVDEWETQLLVDEWETQLLVDEWEPQLRWMSYVNNNKLVDACVQI